MSYHTYAVVRGDLVRVWSPAASYRKLYPEDCDAWIEGLMSCVGEPDF